MFDKYYKHTVIPIAKKECLYWHKKAGDISNFQSSQFIKNCLEKKILHSLGSSIYAVPLLPGSSSRNKVEKIVCWCVCFQILADLLDSESERKGMNINLVKQMHCLLLDFICHDGKIIKEHYPAQKEILLDICYLQDLVKRGKGLNFLPNYYSVKPYFLNSIKRYSRAQFNSSMTTTMRDKANKKWAKQCCARKYGLKWFEYYASQASTLPIFILISLAAQKEVNSKMIKIIYQKHYSWFSLLHIMFNHLNGIEEDKKLGTINYIFYYGDKNQIKKRLIEIIQKTKIDLQELPNADFYLFILHTLIKKYIPHQPKWHNLAELLKKESEDLKRYI